MLNTRTALVTGGSGFAGSNLCRKLINEGWMVNVVTVKNDNLYLLEDIRNSVIIHVYDGSIKKLDNIFSEVKPDIVFHLASLFLSEHTQDDIEGLIASNVLFGTQLLEMMTVHGVTKFINTGTSWQHYENKHYSPVNLYAATKQAFEDILLYYVESKKISAVTLKLFDTYGPNDPRPKLFHLLEKVAREGAVLAMSPGDQPINLVYIDDVVDAFVVAAERIVNLDPGINEHYAVSSDEVFKLKDIVNIFSDILGVKLFVEWGGRPYRTREVMSLWSSGLRLPGWNPKFTIVDGINKVIDVNKYTD